MACFGYQNVNTESVYIPVGSLNRFTPDNPDRGQNTIFFPGRQKYAFCIQMKEGDTVTWHLLDRAAKVKTNCPDNKKKKSLMK
jgi:hypothetical protein